jgi:hypothetical protein
VNKNPEYVDSDPLLIILIFQGLVQLIKGFTMSEKKVVGRRIAIVLGIICVVLAVALVSVVSEAYLLNNIADLRVSQVWFDHWHVGFGSYGETDFDSLAGYAGYVTVQFESASSGMYVEVSYDWAHVASGLVYSRRVTMESGEGNFTFPVLPSSVRIAVGNLVDSQGSAVITATYFY